MAKRRGLLARVIDGRLDRSILADVGVVLGLGCVGYGIRLVYAPAVWIFLGAAVMGLSVVSMLPAKKAARSPKETA